MKDNNNSPATIRFVEVIDVKLVKNKIYQYIGIFDAKNYASIAKYGTDIFVNPTIKYIDRYRLGAPFDFVYYEFRVESPKSCLNARIDLSEKQILENVRFFDPNIVLSQEIPDTSTNELDFDKPLF
jgi:hypothetical protein